MRIKITKRVVDATESNGKRVFVWDTDVTGFGLQVTKAGTKSYVFQYRMPGKGRQGSARRIALGRHGDLTPDQARRIAAEHLVSVRSGVDPKEERDAGGGRTVADLARRYLTEYLPNKKKPPRQSTVDFYKTAFNSHILPRLGGKFVADVTEADAEKLHAAMRETPYMANRTLTVLGQSFDQAERWGWRPKHSNPASAIERYPEERRGARKEVMLTPAQMKALLAALDDEQAEGRNPIACDAIRVIFWTGWRVMEVLSLRWDDIDFEVGVARLRDTKTADEEYRQVPHEALEILKAVPKVATCPYIFVGEIPNHLTTLKKPWAAVRKRAKLDDLDELGALRLHDLRHNVVSWDVSRGVPLEIAGKNVGHRSRRSTEIYAHFAPDALKQAADARAAAMRASLEESAEEGE